MEALTNKLRVFTAFSGYDSQCLALKRLAQNYPGFEFELVGWSEIDKDAIKAHNILFPEYEDRNYGDISKIDWNDVPDFDLFTYSSPCQDFSLAGKQRGAEEGSGTRSSLLWECRRCIEAKRPKYLLLENVTALVSKKFYPLFEKWMNTVQSFGYENFWNTLNAKDFGVPQNRDRVFLVSIRKDNEEIIDYNFPNTIETDCKIEDILETGDIDEKYFINQDAVDKWVVDNETRISEYIAERNGISPESLEYEQNNDSDVQYKENVTEQQEMECQNNECLCDVETAAEEINEQENEQKLSLDSSLYPEVTGNSSEKLMRRSSRKSQTRGGRLVEQIPTPTTSSGAAPTLMATGYDSAGFKNFYSVGHFPKLGVMEVWTDDTDTVTDYTHNTMSYNLF